jgi:hypothetical protein
MRTLDQAGLNLSPSRATAKSDLSSVRDQALCSFGNLGVQFVT